LKIVVQMLNPYDYRWYQNSKWRSHFEFWKPLLGLVFNSQKCCHTFV